MQEYLDMLCGIRAYGRTKHPTRVESGATVNPTVGVPNLHFSFNMARGFPLLTTRKLNWQAMVGELRSFLMGCTTHFEFAAHGCNFWLPWAAKNEGNLGPIYGAQWRRFGQLQHVLDCLRNRPTDRRMVVSAWLPDEIPAMVLPPCHLMWCVTPYDGKLSLAWMQRSCDFPLGVPYNIASYALLTHILAKWAGMGVGNLSAIFCDAHIYVNQLDGVDEQLKRTPGKFPTVSVWFEDDADFNSWRVALHGYEPQEAISFGSVEV